MAVRSFIYKMLMAKKDQTLLSSNHQGKSPSLAIDLQWNCHRGAAIKPGRLDGPGSSRRTLSGLLHVVSHVQWFAEGALTAADSGLRCGPAAGR